jgi:hypothetical protein
MPADTLNTKARINTLNAVIEAKKDQQALSAALTSAKGDWTKALGNLKKKLPAGALQRVTVAHSLAAWADDHVPVVKALADQDGITNLRDVALQFNTAKLTAMIDAKALPADTAGATAKEKKKNFAVALQRKLFAAEPTAVLQRMALEAELPIADKTMRAGLGTFLGNQPDFNIRTTSIHKALKHPEAFKGIAEAHRDGVVEHLKTLQRIQAISPIPEAVPVLMKANLTSAFRVAEMAESTFLTAHSATLGEETARQVYTNAINTHIRNEHALMTMREAWRGTGLAIIDGQQPMEARMAKLQGVADKQDTQLNLETLFGSIDYCECEDCLSVYSPAAYFVDILQYLRNNNLGPDPTDPSKPSPGIRTDLKDIKGTPLEKLFRRRPDLGCLELTCENTFTVLPYIDLVNEVMESFVVHLDNYRTDAHIPKQAILEAFNVEDETTSELLAQPQHINYKAYCILKDAVYPFTLPYHQPIDVARIFLKYLGTSRYELLDTYRTATETASKVVRTPAQQQELQKLHGEVLDRSANAEFLGITQEEHIILTREAFWSKAYFDLTLKKVHSQDDYQKKIGVRLVHEYYNYETEADMLSVDETSKLGLTFVKKQFLLRTGIQYVDLVEMLKTRFINPAYPQGAALTLLEGIRFSYRFLQTLVDASNSDRERRYAKLIQFLNDPQTLVPEIDALAHPDPCHQQNPNHCLPHTDLRNWVYCYFERIGKLIVLESGEGPHLSIEGQLVNEDGKLQGRLNNNGTVVDVKGRSIGKVTSDFQVVTADGKPLFPPGTRTWLIQNSKGERLGYMDDLGIYGLRKERFKWLPARDTCDLAKVRLAHLDGSMLTVNEYDRMQRFIRLWHKLGWTIAETDLAVIASASLSSRDEEHDDETDADPLANPGTPSGKVLVKGNPTAVGFDVFQAECTDVPDGSEENGCPIPEEPENNNCPDMIDATDAISAGFLNQMVAIKKLLDLTGLPLDKLLSFWTDINTAGDKSLYARLFLTHNLLSIDKVFKSDANGNFLTKSEKLSEHMPVLMAALRLKAVDLTAIIDFRTLSDALTLRATSVIYGHSLLAKILHVRVEDLPEVIRLFGDPFNSPQDALALLQDWGKMEDAGFTFNQLNYLIRNHDDPKRPLAPTKKSVLQITKALYDGLNAIDEAHPNIPPANPPNKDAATADLVRAKAGLLYEPGVVEQIIGLLEGTTVYTTNAPAKPSLKIPKELEHKLKYSYQKDATSVATASIQVTGILTDDEKTLAKTLSKDSTWSKAIDRVGKKALQFFNDTVIGIFPTDKEDGKKTTIQEDAQKKLLAGDANVQPNPADPDAGADNTAPGKRYYFIQYFLPFLRQRLVHQLIVNTMSGAAGLPADITDVLLSDVLVVGQSDQPAIKELEQIHQKPASSGSTWKGYLIPSVDDAYTFVANSLVDETAPPNIVIDGQSIPFTVQQEDPSDVWSTDPKSPLKLKSGKLYLLEFTVHPAAALQWKTSASPTAVISSSALLPDYSSSGTEEVFIKLYKGALLVNGFSLNVDEVNYWQSHGSDFADNTKNFDFNALTLGHWRRLQSYASLRDKLPKTDTSLLTLFRWATKPDDAKNLSARIAAATLWRKDDIEKLIAPTRFDLNRPEKFRNEVNLMTLQKGLQVADKIGADIDRLFTWANPVSKFSICYQIAEGIRATLRARYDQEDWEKVIKPLNDQLRENQKQALISYLLVQQDLIDWGVADADSLFEFFLIDVQMSSCMKTSRIKQAISTVQLFVQRCLLGLEDRIQEGVQIGVPTDALSRSRWEWMQKYRVWEANRKIFLYPENWIRSELRDDKSPFYKELESELLQKDINTQTIEDALKSYLFKVDEVADLKVVGLFMDEEAQKLHVFSRTKNAPYFFYYRYFQVDKKDWYPWEKVQVDIPSYDLEGTENDQVVVKDNGAYLIPVVWNNRLLIFFPQFMKKTASRASAIGNKTFKTIGEGMVSSHKPIEYWEIKMGWSEYRNQKWTQKQVSTQAVYGTLSAIDHFRFAPRIMTGAESRLAIEVFSEDGPISGFTFSGSQIFSASPASTPAPIIANFHVLFGLEMRSLQAVDTGPRLLESNPPFFSVEPEEGVLHFRPIGSPMRFEHPFMHEVLGKIALDGLEGLFDYYTKLPDDSATVPHKVEAFGGDSEPIVYHELKRPYSLYNWEAAFHAPMLLVDRLLAAKQFDHALKMCHYVLNPYAKGVDAKRFWQFPPFKEIDATNTLEKLFLGLQANQPDTQINEWRDKPFQPHVVARSRPSAYMKWVAMKYIEILIAYGDHYFRQNTLETIPLAIQCYVLASHIYGPAGQKIPKRGEVLPQTYNSLLDKWDAFSNAMVELELAFPFSNQTPLPSGASNGVVGLANIFGFASTLYFCIPDNPQLRSLRETIGDRLFKIRHCQDIDGIFRELPLFEPPIDPALLVQAAAQGLSLSNVLNDFSSPMPNYRFAYLLQRAFELCSKLETLGNVFLSAKEKGDGEALSQLRASHESSIQNLAMEVKKLQLDEAGKAMDALQQSRKGPVYRLQHYLKLIGEDLGKVPDENTDFGELPNQIEQPIDESGLKLIKDEKEEIDKASAAADWQVGIGITETLASILHIIPYTSADVKPIGIGAGVVLAGNMFGNAAQSVARGMQTYSNHLTYQSTSAGRKAGFLRQLQERVQQANTAGYEIKNIDKQILTQQIRINITNQEITNQQKQIDNAQEMEDFIRNKYTNKELYSWMVSQLSALQYQTYTLAYDLAKRAENVFRFERGLTTSNFIHFGNWDIAHDGLLAGERLYVALKQLEAAYQEKRGHDFELSKSISLRQLNPLALIQLKETGTCEFSLPEVLFDMDYPGHYLRRIKTVSLKIPCILGTYTSLNCTLRLLEHKFRINAVVNGKNDYPEQTDDRFRTVNVPITSIAVSSLEDENGVFELNFQDERYLPFEGAGCVSKWRCELLPKELQQFDYDTITDVVIKMRYTSVDGGDKLKRPASDAVLDYINSVEELSQEEGLFAAFDLKNDFPNEWYTANHPPAGVTERVMNIDKLSEKLPFFAKGRLPSKIRTTDIYLLVSGSPSAPPITATQGGTDIPFTPAQEVGTMKSFVAKGVDASMDNLQIKILDTKSIDKIWLLERYVLA